MGSCKILWQGIVQLTVVLLLLSGCRTRKAVTDYQSSTTAVTTESATTNVGHKDSTQESVQSITDILTDADIYIYDTDVTDSDGTHPLKVYAKVRKQQKDSVTTCSVSISQDSIKTEVQKQDSITSTATLHQEKTKINMVGSWIIGIVCFIILYSILAKKRNFFL